MNITQLVAGVTCPLKKWHWLWGGKPHDFEITRIYHWAFEKYEFYWKCTLCKAQGREFGISETQLVAAGFPIEEIREKCRYTRDCWSPPKPEGVEHEDQPTNK